MRRTTTLFLIMVLGSCAPAVRKPKSQIDVKPRQSLSAKVQSFSETRPFTSTVTLDTFFYAGTPRGLYRFDLNSGDPVAFADQSGVVAAEILGLAADPSSGLHVVTPAGLFQFHRKVWKKVDGFAAPPASVTQMMASTNGLWIGTSGGLYRLFQGKWSHHLAGAKISAILDDTAGSGMWIGTDAEGIFQYDGKRFRRHGKSDGQVLRSIRSLAYTVEGALWAVGSTGKADRLVFFDGRHWATFQVKTKQKLRWVSLAGDKSLLAIGNRVLQIHRFDESIRGPKDKPVGTVVLQGRRSPRAPTDYPIPSFWTTSVPKWFPTVTTSVSNQAQSLILGTKTIGAMRYDGIKLRWYRSNALTGNRQKIKGACDANACYFPGGRGQAYKATAAGLEPLSVSKDASIRVEAFVKDAKGAIVAIYGLSQSPMLKMARKDGDVFKPAGDIQITLPTGSPSVRFARYAADGKLWLGLAYRDSEGDVRPWGVAVVGKGKTPIHHRNSMLPTEDRKPGSLALPNDIRDVFFGEETWLATDSGVCRISAKGQIQLFTENDGLESELTYAVAKGPSGEIVVASHGGVGRFDGRAWRFDLDSALRKDTRGLVVVGDALWAATSAGVVKFQAGKAGRLSARDGLATDRVLDILPHGEKLLWVLTSKGLSLVQL
jgi:ligand-binding sensor domain-containing protein